MWEESAWLRLQGLGAMALDRDARTAELQTPKEVPPEYLVHPGLAWAASVFTYWDGREGFHCGGMLVDGLAWGVLGGQKAGKSTALAHLALSDHPVLSDDFIAVGDGEVFAGPRCLDLRDPHRLDLGNAPSRHTVRGRTRLLLEAVPFKAPLGGWILLGWAEEFGVERVPARERISLLSAYKPIQREPDDPAAFLDLASRPMWLFLRPRRWELLAETSDRLLTLLSGEPRRLEQ